MSQFTPRDKSEMMSRFLQSSEWDIMKQEIEKQFAVMNGSRRSSNERGEINQSFYLAGYCDALRDVLLVPERTQKSNTKLADKILNSIFGEKEITK